MIGIYFSGTGNSKYCLEVFLNHVDKHAKAYSIEDTNVLEQIGKHQEIIFAYPIQYSNIPKKLHDFIVQNSKLWKNKNVYIIATMGLFSGDGSGVLARLLKHYGSHIQGGLHVKMPDSIADEKALSKSLIENKKIVSAARKKIEEAAVLYKSGKPTQIGLGWIAHCIGLFGQRLYFGYKAKSYSKKLKIDYNKCVRCKKCSTLCPMGNITIENDIPISHTQCTMCYRCINACPTQAITLLGKEVKKQGILESYINE